MTASAPPPQERPAGRHAGPPVEDVGPALRAPRATPPPGAPPPPQGAVAPPQPAAAPPTTAPPTTAPPTAAPPMPYSRRAATPAWTADPATQQRATAPGLAGATGGATAGATAVGTGTGALLADAAPADLEADPAALDAGRTQGAAVPALDTAPPGDDDPRRPRPGRPRPRRSPWTVGGVHLLQVVVWEAVVAVVLAVHREPLAVLVPVAAVAAVALLLTAVRVRGRWLYSWAVLALRYRTRRRSVPLTAAAGSAVPDVVDALLGAVADEARVTTVRLDDQDAGLVVHRDGIAVVLTAHPTTEDPTSEPARTLPPLTALLPPDDGGDVPLTVQLLVQTVPAPGASGDADPAAVSYRQLTGGAVPARRRSWVVLQVRRRPEDDRTEDLVVTLGNAVRRVRRQLGRASLRTHLLGPEDLRSALLGIAGLDAAPDGSAVVLHPSAGSSGPGTVAESWRTWRAGAAVHTTFRLLDWPSLDAVEGQDLVDLLGTTSGQPTTVAVAARRSGDQVELSTSLRVRLPADGAALDEVTAGLTRAATAAGARVERLDGRHRHGMAAALPLGGFLR